MARARSSLKHSVLLWVMITSCSSDRFSRAKEKAGDHRRIPSLVGTVCGAGDELTGLSRDGRGGGFDFYQDADADSAAVVPGADDERSGYHLGYLRFTPGAEFHVCHGVPVVAAACAPPVAVAPLPMDGYPTRFSAGGGGGRGSYCQVEGDLPVAAISTSSGGGGCGAYRQADGALPIATALNGTSPSPRHGSVTDFRGVRTDTCKQQELPLDTTIMHVNIQGLRSHLAELCAVVRLCSTPPDIICINETFLDDAVESIEIEGFTVVGRRDRSHGGDDRKCGG